MRRAAAKALSGGGNLFLDVFPGAYFAIGFKLLRTGYSGPCCSIRRSSDDTVVSVSFDNGELTLDSEVSSGGDLATWIGSDNGFLHTLYGQDVTGRDWVQTTNANQPQIITAGAFVTRGGDISMALTATITLNGTIGGVDGDNDWRFSDLTGLVVGEHSGLGRLLTSSGGSGFLHFSRAAATYQFRHNSTTADLTPRPTNLTEYILGMFSDFSANEVSSYFNGTLQDTDTMDAGWLVTNFRLGGNGNTFAKALIYYADDKSSDMAAMTTKLNDMYGTY